MTFKVYSWLTRCQLTLIRLVSMIHFTSKATPTNDTDYSCHIKVVEFVFTTCMGLISYQIMSLAINSLRADTQIDKQIHTNTQTSTQK